MTKAYLAGFKGKKSGVDWTLYLRGAPSRKGALAAYDGLFVACSFNVWKILEAVLVT